MYYIAFSVARQLLSNIPWKLLGINELPPADIECLSWEVVYPLGLGLKTEGFYCYLKKQIHHPVDFQMQNPEFHVDWNLGVSANPSCEFVITLTAMISTRPENASVLKWLTRTVQALEFARSSGRDTETGVLFPLLPVFGDIFLLLDVMAIGKWLK